MSKLIEHLKSFNRKERSILLEKALGSTTFLLSDKFRDELKKCLNIDIPVCSYVAMDYHIGWIQMAIYLAKCGDMPQGLIPTTKVPGVNDNQRDVDLLVAFTENSVTHLVLIEAKADMSWDHKQLSAKVDKLKESVCPQHGSKIRLKLHLVLMSPKPPDFKRSTHIRVGEWPDWMKKKDGSFYHMPLHLASHLRKITRCDAGENDNEEGDYYKIGPLRKRPANDAGSPNPRDSTC